MFPSPALLSPPPQPLPEIRFTLHQIRNYPLSSPPRLRTQALSFPRKAPNPQRLAVADTATLPVIPANAGIQNESRVTSDKRRKIPLPIRLFSDRVSGERYVCGPVRFCSFLCLASLLSAVIPTNSDLCHGCYQNHLVSLRLRQSYLLFLHLLFPLYHHDRP